MYSVKVHDVTRQSGQDQNRHGVNSERTSLLAPRPPTRTESPRRPPDASSATKSSPRRRLVTISTCVLLITLLELGAYLAAIPLNQVLEEIICRSFHPRPPPSTDDPRCKNQDVQAELSIVRGWQSTLDYIPSLVTAILYGFLADSRGRELVLSLSVLGVTLASAFYILVCSLPNVFSVRVTWLSAAFTFIGGGPPVLNSMVFAIAGDIVDAEQRSTIFSFLAAAVVVGEMIASPLAYYLMGIDAWISIYSGLGCLVLGVLVTLILPETLEKPRYLTIDRAASSSWYHAARLELLRMGEAVLWVIWRDWTVVALLATFLLTTLGRFAQELLLQYVTKRYGWSWSQAGLLLSVRAFFSLVLLLSLIPSATYILIQKMSFSAYRANMLLARASIVLLTIGAFTIGLSAKSGTMVMGLGAFAVGSGYNLLIRSLLVPMVESDHIGMLYTIIGICEAIGALVAGPLLAASFRTGMEWGNAWIGLPYMAAGCLLSLAAILVVLASVLGSKPPEVTRDGAGGEQPSS